MVTDNIGVGEIYGYNDFKVYPNPTDNTLYIEGNNIRNIKIINILGQTIQNTDYRQGCDIISVDCGNLNHGVYYVIISGQNTVVRRFVKR